MTHTIITLNHTYLNRAHRRPLFAPQDRKRSRPMGPSNEAIHLGVMRAYARLWRASSAPPPPPMTLNDPGCDLPSPLLTQDATSLHLPFPP